MATNNSINLGRGTAGEVLTSNGPTANPTFQEAAAGGGTNTYPYPVYDTSSTILHSGYPFAETQTSVNAINSFLYLQPFLLSSDQTITSIACFISTAAAGSSVRMGVYDSTSTGVPNAIVVDGGTVATDTTGTKQVVVSQALSANTLYWLVVTTDENGGSVVFRGYESVNSTFDLNFNNIHGYLKSSVPAGSSLPSPLTSVLPSTSPIPILAVGFD